MNSTSLTKSLNIPGVAILSFLLWCRGMGVNAAKRPLHSLTKTSPFHSLAQSSSSQPRLSLRSSAPHLPFILSTFYFTTTLARPSHKGSSSARVSGALVHREFPKLSSPRLLQSATSLLIIYHRWRRKTTTVICPTQIFGIYN